MKKIKTRALGWLLAVIMVFSVPFSAEAAQMELEDGTVVETESTGSEETVNEGELTRQQEMKYADTVTMTFPKEIKIHTGNTGTYVYSVANMPANGKIKNVTISNKKIAQVTAREGGIAVKAKKAGSATIKFSVKYGTKTKKFTTKLKVYKYTNPIKSYVIGGLELKTRYKTAASYQIRIKKDMNVKLDVKAKSGWKITSFTYYCSGKATRYSTNAPIIKLKKVSGSSIQINFMNKKTGVIENIVLWIRV